MNNSEIDPEVMKDKIYEVMLVSRAPEITARFEEVKKIYIVLMEKVLPFAGIDLDRFNEEQLTKINGYLEKVVDLMTKTEKALNRYNEIVDVLIDITRNHAVVNKEEYEELNERIENIAKINRILKRGAKNICEEYDEVRLIVFGPES